MDRFAGTIVKRKKTVVVAFIIAAVVCVFLSLFVGVNYNMVDYLPADAQSTQALGLMKKEFTQAIPNANVMVCDVSVTEALEYKEKLTSVEGVTQVLWLDDTIDLKKPIEMSDPDETEGFYKNGNALFSVTIEEGHEQEVCTEILAIIGESGSLSGEAPDLVSMQDRAGEQGMGAMKILLPIFLIILVLATTSWIEPLLFLFAIGVSILINMGTNIFFGQVSFMTNSVSPILQLACTLDYAIFLLHSFSANRKKYATVDQAMFHAVKSSFSTIAACAATALFGFLALVFMDFKIGADLGIVLAKGIALSFIAVIIFLPALTLFVYKIIEKTQHRPFMPSFSGIGGAIARVGIPFVIIVVLLVVPGYLGKGSTSFTYGNGSNSPDTRYGRDVLAIDEVFGEATMMVLLVPKGDIVKEAALCDELYDVNHVTRIVSFASTVGKEIPSDLLEQDIVDQFYSKNYARIIIYTDTAKEGQVAFQTVRDIRRIADSYYKDMNYSLGQSTNIYDMKQVVELDDRVVNMIAVISILLVLLITFRSAILPIILILTIEAAIWINLAIPYFSGISINFIGYLVVSTVQLGSTINYAIYYTNHYLENRRGMPPQAALKASIGQTFKAILISACTLAAAGLTLATTSTDSTISDLGMLLGRGTLLSMVLVICFLPKMLVLFDKVIAKTTYRANFYKLCADEAMERRES